MAPLFSMAHTAVQRLFEVVTLLLPLTPLPLVLALELWAVSKYEFSPRGVAFFRLAYMASLIASCYVTLAFIAVFWR